MKLSEKGNDLIVTQLDGFSLKDTLNCGQCFRWDEREDGSFFGVVKDKTLLIKQENDTLTLFNTTKQDFDNFWCEYFDFNTDYLKIKNLVCKDEIMKKASEFAGGIHILKQEAWETLCSFIISQNNNIPRIKGIISRLCETFGEEIESGVYSFPTAEKIAQQTVESLAPLRSGFRAKYIIDAAKKITNGEVNITRVRNSDFEKAKEELMTILGVGTKVADCTLLFGFYKIQAFPEDVWIKRAMATLYPNGLPEEYKQYGGVAQQYLFHYVRNFPEILKTHN